MLRRQDIQDELDDLFRLENEGAGELVLIRHAEPAREHGVSGDPLLSCDGLEQAERLAERLRAPRVDAIYTSPERRAFQTAKLIADCSGRPLEVVEGLREIDFNTGITPASVSVSDYAERFARDPIWDSLPGFAPGGPYRRRVISAIEAVLAENDRRRVAVVTHASAINAYLGMLLCIPRDLFFTPEHASISIVRWQGDRFGLRSLNDVAHLRRAEGGDAQVASFYAPLTAVNNPLKQPS
jgi:probable phosphoglycerate mutase